MAAQESYHPRSHAWSPCIPATVLQNTVCRYFYNGCATFVQVSCAQAGAVVDLSCTLRSFGILSNSCALRTEAYLQLLECRLCATDALDASQLSSDIASWLLIVSMAPDTRGAGKGTAVGLGIGSKHPRPEAHDPVTP